MIQEKFAAEVDKINMGKRDICTEMLKSRKAPFVVFALLPFNHVLVYKKKNNPGMAVNNPVYGSQLVSKFYYMLNSAVKLYVHSFLSVQCQNSSEQMHFLNIQMHSQNFRNRMEEGRIITCKYLLTEGCEIHVEHIKEYIQFFGRISAMAEAAAIQQVESGGQKSSGALLCGTKYMTPPVT
jgi:hypothetical protein